MYVIVLQGSHASWKVLNSFYKISGTWKVLGNAFAPGKYWKLKFNVLESKGIYLWFKLTNMPFMLTAENAKCK